MAGHEAAGGIGSLALLRTNPAFRRLWTARAVSYFGDSLALVALMLHVAETTGQALAVATLLLVGDFAPALLGPLVGTVSDRFDLKRVMVVCELAQAVLVAVIALWLPALPMLLCLIALHAVVAQVFQPACRAAAPAVVSPDDLPAANAAVGWAPTAARRLARLRLQWLCHCWACEAPCWSTRRASSARRRCCCLCRA